MAAKGKKAPRVFVVDDEESMRELLDILLGKDGYNVRTFEDPARALDAVGESAPDLVISDLKMPKMNGLELLEKLKLIEPDLPVIVITAFSSWDTAVSAMRLGAYDYIKKPFDNESIRTIVRRAVEQHRLADRTGSGAGGVGAESIIGDTPVMHETLKTVTRVAATDSTVLITGESGTGKELIARAVHFHSLRSGGPFISVNCGAFTESLLESELFGHMKGSFTGAFSDKKGLLEVANRGTFFLDEVADLAPTTQVKLLRVLEERRFIPVGSTAEHTLDVRFIAATNRNLLDEVKRHRFREDLYYRLNVIPMSLPPLRDRREDIPLLAGYFLASYSRSMHKDVTGFTEDVIGRLMECDWPGNIRELDNVIQRAVAMSEGPVIRTVDVAEPLRGVRRIGLALPPGGIDIEKKLEEIEKHYIEQALAATGGNITKAAEMLGLTFRSMRYKLKKLEMKKKPGK